MESNQVKWFVKKEKSKGTDKDITYRSIPSTRGAIIAPETIIEVLYHNCSAFYENAQAFNMFVPEKKIDSR